MIEWAATAAQVCGFGERGTVVLETDGWRPGGHAARIPVDLDAELVGTADAIRLPADGGPIHISSSDDSTDGDDDGVDSNDGGGDDDAPANGRPLSLGELADGRHRIVVESGPETHVAFHGPATVEDTGTRWIRFPARTSVTVGFRETLSPRPTVRVPKTASGLATAVTAAGRTHTADGPERSHPGFRPRTPRVTFGDRSLPDRLEEVGSGPRMTVPDSVSAVLVAAPLAYYLGATLEVESGPPTVSGDGLEHTFAPFPDFADEAAEALRGLCTLDSRLRSIPGESGPLPADGAGNRDATWHDAADLESATPAGRLAAVLESPPGSMPEWPLATYVDDDPANGRYLPHLLDPLSTVYPASASPLDPKALLKRALDEFYRGETPNVEAVDPALADSRFHAWLGDGTPVDAYTLLEGQRAVDGSDSDSDSGWGLESGFDAGLVVDVVCNDPAMAAEQRVAEVYRSRLAGRNVTVRTHERLSTADLAEILERPTDLVHFVGHCEVGGMVCPDGTLAAADLESVSAEAFFLNACGSYHEGYDLVRRGASVGAVTLTTVLDEQAVALGTTFAELLAAGFAFDRALSLARGEIVVGKDYVVVGDGTHRLRPPRGTNEVIDLTVDDAGDSFTLRYDATAPDSAGRRYAISPDEPEHLWGETTVRTLGRDATVELLRNASVPVRYEGSLRWSTDLASRFESVGQQS